MRKTIKLLIIAVVIIMMLAAFAASCLAKGSRELVVDNEGLFDVDEMANLESYLHMISEKHQCEIVVVTAQDFYPYSSAESYAENYYDTHGYGYGSDASGVLLFISEEQRYYHICTTGMGEDALDGSELEYLLKEVQSLLSEDKFYDASYKFAEICDQTLTNYRANGDSFDTGAFVTGIVISAIIGIIASIITILVLKYKMNNARPQSHASYYERDNSFDLRVANDIYLYSTVRKIRRSKSSSSSGGRSHGGGGGRF